MLLLALVLTQESITFFIPPKHVLARCSYCHFMLFSLTLHASSNFLWLLLSASVLIIHAHLIYTICYKIYHLLYSRFFF